MTCISYKCRLMFDEERLFMAPWRHRRSLRRSASRPRGAGSPRAPAPAPGLELETNIELQLI